MHKWKVVAITTFPTFPILIEKATITRHLGNPNDASPSET
jgi:hypothetical protein